MERTEKVVIVITEIVATVADPEIGDAAEAEIEEIEIDIIETTEIIEIVETEMIEETEKDTEIAAETDTEIGDTEVDQGTGDNQSTIGGKILNLDYFINQSTVYTSWFLAYFGFLFSSENYPLL